MVSSGGDPMVFLPLEGAQEAQFLEDNDAIVNERKRRRMEELLVTKLIGTRNRTIAGTALQKRWAGVDGLCRRQAAGHRPGTGVSEVRVAGIVRRFARPRRGDDELRMASTPAVCIALKVDPTASIEG
jgi:hypothetical protein